MTSEQSDDCCPNCSAPLRGPYCSECGQHQLDLDRPFRDVVTEGLSTFVSFDRRIAGTLWPLIRRPGFLTTEFLAGRRARYVHPFKLYFAFSLVFFLVFSFSDYSIIHTNEPGIVSITTIGAEASDEANQDGEGSEEDLSISVDNDGTAWISEFFAPLEELAENDPDRLNQLFIDRLSKSLIILVPMVAFLLQMIFWRPRYVAHLIFALHLHSFSFVVLVLGALVDWVGAAGLGNNIATLGILIYTFLALRRVYGQSRFVTTLKILVLVFGYVVALVTTMLMTFVATVASI
jgi:hypothetical protein